MQIGAVGITGLEPATSRPPDACATNCAKSRFTKKEVLATDLSPFATAKVVVLFQLSKFYLYFCISFSDIDHMFYSIAPPTVLNAKVLLPPSKSISNRVLVIGRQAGCIERLRNLSDCDDTSVMRRALELPSEITDIMAAGTAMRFLTAYYSAVPVSTVLTGTDRMRHRPIRPLVDALRSSGADISYAGNEGFPPLRIKGRQLKGGTVTMRGDVSSQYTSALLMIGPLMKEGLRLKLTGNIVSRPYINMTVKLMTIFGADVKWMSHNELVVGTRTYRPVDFTVENDWSAASYWYETLALSDDPNASVHMDGLNVDSIQGDAELQRLFEPLGVETVVDGGGITLRKSGADSNKYCMNMEKQPDLAQTVIVTCAMLERPFEISGLQSLRIKETDRLKALRTELKKFNIDIKESNGDTLSWNGRKTHVGATPAINTYEDHRMAMSFAPCALKYPGIRINNPKVVSKSYPNFWEDLRTAGFTVQNK